MHPIINRPIVEFIVVVKEETLLVIEFMVREMELKIKVLLKVASLLFLLGFVSTTVYANYEVKSTEKPCCDNCPCTKSIPPQCRCEDIGETCHSACKSCFCTRSIPPQCRCADITDFCYESCHSYEPTKAH